MTQENLNKLFNHLTFLSKINLMGFVQWLNYNELIVVEKLNIGKYEFNRGRARSK